MKIQRLLMILFYLISHELVKVENLCELLEVSKRTVYRDLELLRTAGVEIESFTGMNGGLRLASNFSMDQLLLDKKEWRTVMFNSFCVGQLKDTQYAKQAREIYDKLSGLFVKDAEEEQEFNILFDLSYKYQGPELIQKINFFEEVTRKHQLVNICYNSPFCDHLSTNGIVAPYGLVNKVGFWYLIGFCYIHNMFRAFNLAYIVSYSQTDKEFVRDKSFSLEEFWSKCNPR